MVPVTRLQEYLRHSARQQYEALAIPPFTLFFHPSDPFPHFSYAIPDEPVAGELGEPLARLLEAFGTRGRQPRFEFIEEFAPGLPTSLREAGFLEEARQQLMTCTSAQYQSVPLPTGLAVTLLEADAPATDIRAFLTAQREGFDPDNRTPATEQDAEGFRPALRHGAAFLARLDEEPVGAAMFTGPWSGMTEVLGIATRPAYRRRGVASALTGRALEEAFARGVEVALLSAADATAGRVYERVGFQPRATMLVYS